jgi:hypothetical protein
MLATALGPDEPAELFDERGARIGWDALPGLSVEALAAHPDGPGWVALVAVLEGGVERDDAPLGLVELRSRRPPSKPLLVPGSYGGAGAPWSSRSLRAHVPRDWQPRRRTRPATTESQAPPTHSLPPLGHEVVRALVPGLGEAVRAAVRYVRALPGWDETQTLGDDVADLAPVRGFLAGYRADMAEAGVDPDEGAANVERLSRHLDYCIDFELQRRKLFFADASLAWMLAHTSLDIEGRALRLPFPCFALAFTDRATLERAGALLEEEGLAAGSGPLRVLTVFVKRVPASEGRRGVSFSMVFDAGDGQWPHLLRRVLCFGEDDDLDDILDSRIPGSGAGRVRKRPCSPPCGPCCTWRSTPSSTRRRRTSPGRSASLRSGACRPRAGSSARRVGRASRTAPASCTGSTRTRTSSSCRGGFRSPSCGGSSRRSGNQGAGS